MLVLQLSASAMPQLQSLMPMQRARAIINGEAADVNDGGDDNRVSDAEDDDDDDDDDDENE
jgi:hypothetical protein